MEETPGSQVAELQCRLRYAVMAGRVRSEALIAITLAGNYATWYAGEMQTFPYRRSVTASASRISDE